MTSDRVPDRCGSASDSTVRVDAGRKRAAAVSLRAPGRRLRSVAAALVAAAGVITIATTFEASPSRAGSDPVGVILVSWDGVRYDLLKGMIHWQPISEPRAMCPGDEDTLARLPQACGEFWSCLPNLCKFEIMESHVTTGKTMTRVQHASMLSGMPPDKTGINTNNGSSSMPYGMTIYERLDTFGPDDVQFMHVGSYRYTVRGILNWVAGSIVPDDNISSRGRPDHFTGRGSNEKFLPMLAQAVNTSFFGFQHQKGVDLAGHSVGDQSFQYLVAMVAADDRLKELLDELDRLGIGDRTHVFITTDHGFWQNQHLGGIRASIGKTWFASRSDKLLCYTRANVIDVVPTILTVFGVNPAVSLPYLAGRSLLDPERVGECIPPTCGDGIIEVGEDCEPGQPVADTCESLGYQRGTLSCGADCNYDTSDCADLLALTRLSIESSPEGGVDITVKMSDRDRGGPEFDPVADAIDIEVLNGADVLWTGGTENYDPSWRIYGQANSWAAVRGTRADGLVGVKLSSPVKRMKMQIEAGSVEGVNDFLSLTAVRTVIHAGQERFDANLLCHNTHDELGLRCSYEKPRERHHR